MATAFGMGDASRARTLFEDAGFESVTITPRELVVVFPSRKELVRRTVESLAGVLPELVVLDEVERRELVRAIDEDAGTKLNGHTWGLGIAAPMSAYLIEARAR